MAKAYNSPQMRVIGVNNVIVTSLHTVDSNYHSGYQGLAPGQRGVFDWDAGY